MFRSPLPRRSALALVAAAALALGACGDDDDNGNGNGGGNGGDENTLDASAVEDKLQEGLSSEGGPGEQLDVGPSIEVTSVECPDDVPKEKGAEFECDMEANDLKDDVELTGTVTVTLEDAEGESLKYQTDLTGPGKTVKQSGTL
jgi:hypothetical protein